MNESKTTKHIDAMVNFMAIINDFKAKCDYLAFRVEQLEACVNSCTCADCEIYNS